MPANAIAAWKQAHERLVELAKRKGILDVEEGELLLDAHRAAAHVFLGFATFEQYVDFLLGYSPRMTQERLRVARSLRQLPELRAAMKHGRLSWSAARELTRVAIEETEVAWLQAAKNKTVRQVEELVCGHAVGDMPADPVRSEARRHLLRFEVSAETYAMFREACNRIRRDSGENLDDDSMLLLIARGVLEGPKAPGRASYQVAVTRCPDCNRGTVVAGGDEIQAGPEVLEMALCDAEHVGDPHDTHVGAPTSQTIPPAIRRRVVRRDHGRCQVPGCRCSLYVDIHHLHLRSEGGDHHPDRLLVLCAAHHRAVHRGTLIIEGGAVGALVFRHADGTCYGGPVRVETAAAFLEAHAALRSLGFGETESRGALAGLRDQSAQAGELVRSALRLLRPAACVREGQAHYGANIPQGLASAVRHAAPRSPSGYRDAVPHSARRALASATASV